MGSPMSQVTRNKRRRRGRGRSRNKAFLALMVLGIVAVLAGLGAVGYVVSIAASAPPLTSLKPKAPGNNTRVYAADGQSLGWIQADDLHLPMTAKEVPKVVKDATIAIEDERYYKHKGVDYEGVVRAAVKNFSSRKTVQGGSTITMQLVRSLYISSERTYERKIREAKLAEELEKAHPKEWILDKYLDSIPYGTVGGQSAIGIKAAARIFFSKRLEELDLHEAALLAGLPQAPSDYSPTRSAGGGQEAPQRGPAQDGGARDDHAGRRGPGDEARSSASSSRPTSRAGARSYFFDYVKDQLFREYGARTVRVGGMKVYTTIDLEQAAGGPRGDRAATSATIGPSSAIVTINPKNGYIEAMASSGDYGVSKFNLAAQGHRRPGLDVQGDGADDRAAQGRQPRQHALRVQVAHGRARLPVRATSRSGPTAARAAAATCPAQGDARLRQLGLHPARDGPGPGRGQEDGARHGHHVDAQRLSRGDARRPGERRLAAGDGRRPTRSIASQGYRLRPIGHQADRVARRARREGQGAAAPLPRQAHPHLRRRRDRRGHPDPRAEHPVGHRPGARRSAARRPARRARPTRTPTPGSSASRRA